jgi:hypothetical protein
MVCISFLPSSSYPLIGRYLNTLKMLRLGRECGLSTVQLLQMPVLRPDRFGVTGFATFTIQVVDFTLSLATKAVRKSRNIALFWCYTSALEGGKGSMSRSGRFLPPAKTRYPLYRRLGGPQGRSGQVRKISPPPGFHPQTIQPVASRCTDWATRPNAIQVTVIKQNLRKAESTAC